MRKLSDLRPIARTYVTIVTAVGLAAVLQSIVTLYRHPIAPEWLVLAGLTLLTGSFTIKVPSVTARLTVSETFVFASVLFFGTPAGTLTVVLETLIVALWIPREKRSVYRAVFNVAASALSIWLAGSAFFAMAGVEPLWNHDTALTTLFVPLAVLTLIFFICNSALVATAVGLERSESAITIWWKNFTWVSINYFSGASVAIVIVTYTNTVDGRALFGTFVIVVPLLLVSYLTFRMAMARVEDTNQHLSELNRLYMSTIETLAMAIDAKDQITHGHIRRVQAYAVGLARHVGISDDKLIRAIEAAALLHDMGKLAVPEYILNKPGKLTVAEFDKMKLHATVGADILSSIAFPYPVVPIVRHHHENWDGTGYPHGLKGTDIPIGARILAVVDCFDALTSDRPYRPRLGDDEALEILMQRRGAMYDPLIVDTFVRVHREIAPGFLNVGTPRRALNEITGSTQPVSTNVASVPFDEITASADEMLTLYDLARALAGHVGLADAGDVIAKHLKRLIPSTLCIFYVFDPSTDEIEAKHAVGDGSTMVRGIRMSLGQRLSGWVGANRQTICNSDPVLDLGDAARSHALNLRSCLSTPLVFGDKLIGVLALYSTDTNGFNDDHRRVIEAVARQLSHTFDRVHDFEMAARRDPVTGLPSVQHLESIITDANADDKSCCGARFTLLLIDVIRLKEINKMYGRSIGDDVLRHVVVHVRSALRVADLLFRHSSDDFVALLNDTDPNGAKAVALRILNNLRENVLTIRQTRIPLDVEVTIVPPAVDGQSLPDRLAIARVLSRRSDEESGHSVIH